MYRISSVQDRTLESRLRQKLLDQVRPHRTLGLLETIALQLGLIQKTAHPEIIAPHVLVFAADHGVSAECVSSFLQSATSDMVRSMLDGHSATNVLCCHNRLQFRVVDAGVKADLPSHPLLISKKVGYGTNNFATEAAMSEDQLDACLVRGAEVVNAVVATGCNTLLIGEVGVGSSTSAAAIMHAVTRIPLEVCVGAGSGVGQLTQARKKVIADVAFRRLGRNADMRDILRELGGFEIVMMAGAILRAAELRMAVVIDGFIVAVAALIASRLHRDAIQYCIFSDLSDERGHGALLALMGARPLLPLSLHRGEGLAATLMYPVIAAACTVLGQSESRERTSQLVEEMYG